MLTPTETLLTHPQIQNRGKYTAQKCRLGANLKVQFQENGQP